MWIRFADCPRYSRQAFYQLQQYEYKYQAQSQIVLEKVKNATACQGLELESCLV
jgi:hypothetical protein